VKHALISFFVVVLAGFACNSFAQPRKLFGVVLNAATRKPMKDVNITVQGSLQGAVTNYLGAFELTIEDPTMHHTLVASHIGFKTVVLTPKDDRFRFSMESEFVQLNDILLGRLQVAVAGNTPDPIMPADYVIVEQSARYPGGVDRFLVHAGNVLQLALGKVENKFMISFTIDATGKPVDIQMSDSKKEIIDAVNNMFHETGDWIPATQRGNKVSQYFRVFVSRGVNQAAIKNLYAYLTNNIRYPAEARRNGIEGAVDVEFTIDSEGNVTDIDIIKGISTDIDSEVKVVLARTSRAIAKDVAEGTGSSRFVLPLSFGLGKSFQREPVLIRSESTYSLGEITITAMGVERTTKVTGYNPAFGPPNNKRTVKEPGYSMTYTHTDLEKAKEHPNRTGRLALKAMELNAIPDDVFTLTKLKFLDLESNNINKIDERIGALTDLRELFLPLNKIETLPDAFSQLEKLTVLALARNEFKQFPLPILKLKSLQALDLGNNDLTSIPKKIRDLKKLRTLAIGSNNIGKLPPALFEMKHLFRLELTGNPIDPKEIEQLKKALPRTEITF
jgi:TonB family protein